MNATNFNRKKRLKDIKECLFFVVGHRKSERILGYMQFNLLGKYKVFIFNLLLVIGKLLPKPHLDGFPCPLPGITVAK